MTRPATATVKIAGWAATLAGKEMAAVKRTSGTPVITKAGTKLTGDNEACLTQELEVLPTHFRQLRHRAAQPVFP